MVMSREKWRQDQADLRREAQAQRRRKYAQFRDKRSRRWPFRQPADEARYRRVLDLPAEGKVDATQIRAAFRRLASSAHPDGGGSHELFIRVTEARDALLSRV